MNKKFILLVACNQPYPVKCEHAKAISYIRRERNESTIVKDYLACSFPASGKINNRCQYAALFNPIFEKR